MMLDRMEGNAELKTSVQQMLATRRLTHSVLLVGEAGLGTGFSCKRINKRRLADIRYSHNHGTYRAVDDATLSVTFNLLLTGFLHKRLDVLDSGSGFCIELLYEITFFLKKALPFLIQPCICKIRFI